LPIDDQSCIFVVFSSLNRTSIWKSFGNQNPITGFVGMVDIDPYSLGQWIEIHETIEGNRITSGDKDLILTPGNMKEIYSAWKITMQVVWQIWRRTFLVEVDVKCRMNISDSLLLYVVFKNKIVEAKADCDKEPQGEEK